MNLHVKHAMVFFTQSVSEFRSRTASVVKAVAKERW